MVAASARGLSWGGGVWRAAGEEEEAWQHLAASVSPGSAFLNSLSAEEAGGGRRH